MDLSHLSAFKQSSFTLSLITSFTYSEQRVYFKDDRDFIKGRCLLALGAGAQTLAGGCRGQGLDTAGSSWLQWIHNRHG